MRSVRDAESIKDTWRILNKNATGEEKIWGIRFFVLLAESMEFWIIVDQAGDFQKTVKELKAEGVLFPDHNIYISTLGIDLPKAHAKLQAILEDEGMDFGGEKQRSAPKDYDKPVKNNDKRVEQNKMLIDEFHTLQNNYLNSLFRDRVDPDDAMRDQILLTSFYDDNKQKINAFLFTDNNGLTDKETKQMLDDEQFISELEIYLSTHDIDYSDKKNLKRTQKKVYDLLENNYKTDFPEYKPYTLDDGDDYDKPKQRDRNEYDYDNDHYDHEPENNQLHNDYDYNSVEKGSFNPGRSGHLDNEKSIYDYNKSFEIEEGNEVVLNTINDKREIKANRFNDIDNDKREFKSNRFNDIDNDKEIDEIESENSQLIKQKEDLKKQIENLKRKEREMKFKVEKSRISTSSQNHNVNPKLLIEEINKKDREYEMLKTKYNSLMNDMNSRVYHDYGEVDKKKAKIRDSIMESVYKLEDRPSRRFETGTRYERSSGYTSKNDGLYRSKYTSNGDGMYKSKYTQNGDKLLKSRYYY